jgi:hypothetical protein
MSSVPSRRPEFLNRQKIWSLERPAEDNSNKRLTVFANIEETLLNTAGPFELDSHADARAAAGGRPACSQLFSVAGGKWKAWANSRCDLRGVRQMARTSATCTCSPSNLQGRTVSPIDLQADTRSKSSAFIFMHRPARTQWLSAARIPRPPGDHHRSPVFLDHDWCGAGGVNQAAKAILGFFRRHTFHQQSPEYDVAILAITPTLRNCNRYAERSKCGHMPICPKSPASSLG